MDKMITVTVKFVVSSVEEADSLMDEIAQDIGNDYGVPFTYSDYADATADDLASYQEVTKRE